MKNKRALKRSERQYGSAMTLGKHRCRCILAALLFCLLPGFVSLAQNSGTVNDLDKLYVPDKGSVFNEGSERNLAKEVKEGPDFHNVIEFHGGYLLRNIFALQYERRLTDQFSVQAGLGKVFGTDRIQALISPDDINLLGNTGSAPSSEPLGKILTDGTYKGSNLYFSLAFRLYYQRGYLFNYYNDGNHGGYLEAGIRYYGNKMNYQTPESDPTVIAPVSTIDVKSTIYYMNFGFYFATDGKPRTTHHFYMGLGIRNSSFDELAGKEVNGQYGGSASVDVLTPNRETLLYPVFQLGYELGLGF